MHALCLVLTCNRHEIQTPFVARLLRFGPYTPYIARRGHCEVQAKSGDALVRFPIPEIIPQIDDFSRATARGGLLASPCRRKRSATRCLRWRLRGVEAEDAYPSDKMAIFEADYCQNSLGAAAPRLRRG